MILKSSYLGMDIEIPDATTVSGGEEVRIIPHDTLEDVILNSEAAAAKNINVHYNPVITEPGHYAFMCAISDTDGRRIERLGESTLNTLTTDIAKDYPATMAFKRSFDAAAIAYLGLPGKVYSDQQISSEGGKGEKTGRSFAAPPVEDDVQNTGKKGTAATGAKKQDPPAASGEAAAAPQQPKAETPKSSDAPAAKNSGKSTRKSAYTAPPLNDSDNESLMADSDSSTQGATQGENPPADAQAGHNPSAKASYGAPPLENKVQEEQGDTSSADGEQDEFDTTILKCGQVKRKGLSIRDAYKVNPGSVRWVAEEMMAEDEFHKAQQDACKRFLATLSEKEGQ